ncbi:MAG TPA: MFS transporter [Vicinamibacterales bacterium]|nr:MFS transporter [Vicinamibacterales bacterium]
MFSFWHEASPEARRALVAASLGWLLDAFDVMLYALVLTSLMSDLGMDRGTGGLLASLTLAASALGGIVFGVLADRWGRTRALSLSILIYSVFSAASGFAQTVVQLGVFRFFLGIGMGGEWASGAALVSETWPAKHRGKALGLMQSCWAIGYGAAALVVMIVLPRYGWRAVFFVGVLPALFTLWIRRRVPEPAMWVNRAAAAGAASPLSERMRGLWLLTAALTLMNAATMFAWWGLNLWIPAFLSLPVDQGGVGLTTTQTGWFIVAMQVGMWFGYVTFGFISDRFGRKPTYVVYLVTASALVFIYSLVQTPLVLLLLGPFVAFFGTGYFSGFGAITAEIYPTAIRATAQGVTYNIGRLASASAPFLVGTIAQNRGFGAAFTMTAIAFLIAAAFWLVIPETKGRELA